MNKMSKQFLNEQQEHLYKKNYNILIFMYLKSHLYVIILHIFYSSVNIWG